jgi:uncharacterized membrane protein YidH (DUF202 family)
MRRTYAMNLLFAALVGAAFVAPRFVRGEGLAASAGAVLAFLGILALAVAVAAWQAIHTWSRRRSMPRHEVWLGLAPLVLGGAALIGLIVFLRY